MGTIFLCLLLAVSICFFISKNSNANVVNVSYKNSLKIVTIKKDAKDIEKVLDSIEYTDEYPSLGDADYKIWVENKKMNERIFNGSIWIKDGKIIVFDKLKGKFGYVNDSDCDFLRGLLDSNMKTAEN